MNKRKATKPLTFDDVWAMFADTDRRMKLSEANFDKMVKESDKRSKKLSEDLDKLKEQIFGINESLGQHAEQFFQDALAESLTFGGERYDQILKNVQCSDRKSGIEIDILLVNGKSVVIIEAKNRPRMDDVKELATEKIAKFRRHFSVYQNHKVYIGIAGFSISQKVLDEAKKYGMGIIRQVGKSMEIEAEHLKAY